MTYKKPVLPLTFFGAFVLCTTTAHAYDPETHTRIIERAIDAMMEEDVAPPAPQAWPGEAAPTQADFDAYLLLARSAPAELAKMGTGLPHWVPDGATSLNLLWATDYATASFPFEIEVCNDGPPDANGNPTQVLCKPANCDYYDTDNLNDLSQFRISEFRYTLTSQTAKPCAIAKVAENDPDLLTRVLGNVLGWHATSVDFHLNDTVLWFKAPNSGFLSDVKTLNHNAMAATLGALAFPIILIANWLFDADISYDDVKEFAEYTDPSNQLEGLIPGIGDIRGDDYTGLWHYINIDAAPGMYNHYPGMYYLEGGQEGAAPGAIDFAIGIAGDISGMSLNAYASDGDNFYGQYDDLDRGGPGAWQNYNIAHTEFSSLDNLAQYGWDKWLTSGSRSAEGLAWPLHAIGDACAPHHVIGSTGHGHRPYEAGVEARLDTFFPKDKKSGNYATQVKSILSSSYRWWSLLEGSKSADYPHGNVEHFIEELAKETRRLAGQDGNWAYHDDLSVGWHTLPFLKKSSESAAVDVYEARVFELLELSSAAAVGILTFASQFANDRGNGDHTCPPGTHYEIVQIGCVPTTFDLTAFPLNGCNYWEGYCTQSTDCGDPSAWVCSNSCCQEVLF